MSNIVSSTMNGYLEVTITFLSGQIERSKSQVQPSIKDDCIFIKYMGDNSGGLIVPLSAVRFIKIIPQSGFNLGDAIQQSAAEELEKMKKKQGD